MLKCSSCGEQAAFATTKSRLEKVTESPIGNSVGSVSPEAITALIVLITAIFSKVFEWFERNDEKYVVCKNCGHYEKLD